MNSSHDSVGFDGSDGEQLFEERESPCQKRMQWHISQMLTA